MNKRLAPISIFFALAALWICNAAQAADVRAWLDRNTMQMGETVTLNVEVTGDNGAAKPDFNVLAADFDLLGTQSSTTLNIVNGQTSSKLLWAVGLQPKHVGTLTIPSLSIAGSSTQALSLTVQPAVAGAGAKAGDDLYVEVAVDPRVPYVQQQVSFTVKLYYAINITDGSLDDPRADGLVVRKLGQEANYIADVGGRRYHVLERHYALVPENSGELALPPITFRGHVVDPGDANNFFSHGRSTSAHSEAVTLQVRPRPPVSGNDAWLPARSITLTADGIDASTSARVGEPMTLTLHLKAKGLGFEQLPELKLPQIDGADVYPDKASTQNRDDGEWLYGERERKFAVVPNRPGSLTVPAISVVWWDTAHDRAATSELPAQTLDVKPAAGVAGADVTKAANAANGKIDSSVAVPVISAAAPGVSGDQSAETGMWRLLAFFALALWAATLAAWIGWLIAQRRREFAARPAMAQTDTTAAAARSAFRAACRCDDWPAAARALLLWARATNAATRNLGELARGLSDSAQTAAIGELERACYGKDASPGLAARLERAFANGPTFNRGNVMQGTAPVLPPLYPSRV